MSDYQQTKIKELKSQGWSDASEFYGGYIFRMTSVSGVRAYIYSDWIQFIN